MGVVAERARQGKTRKLRTTFLHKLNLPGPGALIWREMILVSRSTIYQLVLFVIFGTALNLMITRFESLASGPAQYYPFLVVQGVMCFTVSLSLGQMGFVEVLRRVDFQKALPFEPWTSVLFEVAAKSVVASLTVSVGTVVAVLSQPTLASYALAGSIFCAGLSFAICSCGFLITILFPDVDDMTQRQFRAFLFLIGIAVTCFFPVLAFGGLLAINANALIGGLFGCVVALIIGFVMTVVSGRLYATFNPSE